MLKRKNYWLLFAILLLSLTSLSPSMDLNQTDDPPLMNEYQSQSQSSSLRQKGEPAHLRISVSLSYKEFRELQNISSNFELSSGVTVELNNLGEAAGDDALMNELTIGNSPDIVMTEAHHIRELAQQGYLLPVDVYRSSPGGTPLTPLLPLLQWNGYAWGMPLDVDPYIFVYSPKVMKELGAEALPRTLDQWTRLLEQSLKKPGTYVLAMDAGSPYGVSAFLESVGSSQFPGSREALDWIGQARSSIYLTDGQDNGVWNMLREGKIAAAVLPLSEWQESRGGDLVAEAPWMGDPAGEEMLYCRSFALSAQTRSPEAAADWLSYITSARSQLDWLASTGRLPAAEELYRGGLPGGDSLPFDTVSLLTGGGGLAGEPQAGWSEITSAAGLLLTGKLDAAGYIEALSNSPEGEENGP
ncbi:arabinogalactan oligomer / maltooligosaccharide transport system substrate-binding protein [Paenibacillus sophorae]|uniref:Arabinogalactan oligomer / maltooligosaccharide transport system substrate-binding protein n=1 Tax=Paenibacillus sophorae TaxID=1333845 RepID=A0A1H8R6T5_9BACL|nr:extracellular solute-binding protein [Paenibacillus sophorae]QWU14959.1 extracellular solute-binding protein [Paenibacillus sophorae]SEO61633.1 arabinogalactan oligomer / maltooligosaccharide transport system substrate-binding protein [Paenibacillus sophorae]